MWMNVNLSQQKHTELWKVNKNHKALFLVIITIFLKEWNYRSFKGKHHGI